jgi:hypothetical protein
MEISSTNSSIYSAISSAQTTTTQTTNSAFNTLVNSQNQDTTTISSTTNKVYKKIDNLQIELYTTKKDLVAEKKLEDLLDANEIAYDSTEVWIDTEKLFQKIYEVRLI